MNIKRNKGKKRTKYLYRPLSWTDKEWQRHLERMRQLHGDTTKLCGGTCCQNPRKRGELTLQELKQLDLEKSDEIFNLEY